MNVTHKEWQGKAVENITKYLHRGGYCKGDDPQCIGGYDLLNTIGTAMGLPMSNPDNWTEAEMELALKGQLVFYQGQAREAIDVVADQIRYCCSGNDKNFVTVLPIELYHEGKLYEVPLFRVSRFVKSKIYYVDNIGRSYTSIRDWLDYNKCPPGKIAYPYQLKLTKKSGTEVATVYIIDSPSSRVDAKTARGLDTVAAFAGLGSSVALLFVTGGLAAPLVGTAIVTAGYGTTRASYQLIEKAAHGENINPFTNSQSRMLWLGIAANLTSFGAMGASMRLTSMAARGKNISDAFRIVADVATGTNVAVSGLAILNSTIFMIEHHEDLSTLDLLMHGASIAFWTKGVFSYKTANTIISDTENYAFAHISKNLSQEQAAELSALRNRFQNDAQLLQKFHAAVAANIPIKDYSQFLFDALRYYDAVATLSPEQIDAFHSIRNFVRDDIHLTHGLNKISNHNGWSPSETIEQVVNMWQRSTQTNAESGTMTMLREGNIIVGRAPPIKIDQLQNLTPSMIKFFGEHLSQIDVAASRQWSSSVPLLLKLQTQGMFTVCPVTKVINSGRAVIMLNSQLEISIYKLNDLPVEDCKNLFNLIIGTSNSHITDLGKLCNHHRLRLQCQRIESIKKVEKYVSNILFSDNSSLKKIIKADLQSYEKDRLYTFVSEVEQYKSEIYMRDMMKFVTEMQPKNVSELVAYSEFVMTCVEDEVLSLKSQIKKKQLVPPRNKKLADWTRVRASENLFENESTLKQKFENTLKIVKSNNMVGVVTVTRGLSDSALIAAIKKETIRFGGEVSATYHIVKHPTTPLGDYIRQANATIRTSDMSVTIGQEGDVRNISFENNNGKGFLLERDGRVLLCSYEPKN